MDWQSLFDQRQTFTITPHLSRWNSDKRNCKANTSLTISWCLSTTSRRNVRRESHLCRHRSRTSKTRYKSVWLERKDRLKSVNLPVISPKMLSKLKNASSFSSIDFGQHSSRSEWVKWWQATKTSKRAFKRSERRLITQMSEKSSKNSWLKNKHTRNFSSLSAQMSKNTTIWKFQTRRNSNKSENSKSKMITEEMSRNLQMTMNLHKSNTSSRCKCWWPLKMKPRLKRASLHICKLKSSIWWVSLSVWMIARKTCSWSMIKSGDGSSV